MMDGEDEVMKGPEQEEHIQIQTTLTLTLTDKARVDAAFEQWAGHMAQYVDLGSEKHVKTTTFLLVE